MSTDRLITYCVTFVALVLILSLGGCHVYNREVDRQMIEVMGADKFLELRQCGTSTSCVIIYR